MSGVRTGPTRWLLLGFGLLCVAVGAVGIVVPGLPTTGFFVLAAACFSRSSPRFEAWVLGLPGIGPMVADHRAGLGMPRRAKVLAIGSIVVAVGLSAGLALGSTPARVVVVLLGAVGVAFVGWRIPTREAVLASRPERAVPTDSQLG